GTPVPDRSGTGVPKPGEHSPKRLGTIGTKLDFDIILTDIYPTLCLTPEHILLSSSSALHYKGHHRIKKTGNILFLLDKTLSLHHRH
ncbi:hypothetical protein, partial [Prevotella denticola]|uniref:hypothetical protein n=1 Tax=Prevotella denticola TaxID=28129 RepID=UPI001E5AFF0A